MEKKLSPFRVQLLRLLIEFEPTIFSKVNSSNGAKEKPKTVQITEDGSVMFFYGSGPIWWQKLFNTYETVSIIDVAIRIADAITGSQGTRNEVAFDGITKSILDEAIKNCDYNCVVDILFDSIRNGTVGELHSLWINKKNIEKYLKESSVKVQGPLNDTDLCGFMGIRTPDGRILPIRIGRVICN